MKLEDVKDDIDNYFNNTSPSELRMEVVSMDSYYLGLIQNEIYINMSIDMDYKSMKNMTIYEFINFLIRNGYGIKELKIDKLENI